ncbi:Sin3 associated polypeptide p18-domain-containing protein, partial [Ephemerocybe angulata]
PQLDDGRRPRTRRPASGIRETRLHLSSSEPSPKSAGSTVLGLFEDGTLPTTDEHQLFTWRDATLREVLTTLRNTSPHVDAFKHPLARFSFRTIYADSTNKGRFASKELGQVYSRDILGEPGSLASTAPRLLLDEEQHPGDALSQREKEERTLEELRFVPGDYLCVSVLLPKSAGAPAELAIKGSGANAAVPSAGWKTGDREGRSGALGAGAPRGAGG